MRVNNNYNKLNSLLTNKGDSLINNTTSQTNDEVFELLGFDECDLGDFLYFGDSELETQKLKKVLLKYHIINDESDNEDSIITIDGYEAYYFNLKTYITTELQKLNIGEKLPDDIIDISYGNDKYLAKLSIEIDKNVSQITQSNSSELFNDISDLCDLLYLGTNYSILENYNSYNLDNIELVMDKYNELLLNYQEKGDNIKFNYIFNLYTSFIDILNRLCTLNSNDIQRKKTIGPILETIKFKTNESKMIINYDIEHLNVLNNFMGKFMINFSHINYIDSNGKTINKVINEFGECLISQTLGYSLCKSNNFGNKPNTKEGVSYAALGNVSYLLLSMYKKIEFNFPEIDLSKNDLFNKVILNNYKEFLRESGFIIYTTLNTLTLKDNLIDNLIGLYKLGNGESKGVFLNDSNSKINIGNVFNHFYYDNKNPSSDDMEIIHHLLLFNKKTDIENNLHLLDKLLRLKKFENDNLEFFKLKTIDLILNSINHLENKKELINYIGNIINYIDNNNKGSLLLSAYSKIYISLALYFSDIDQEKLDISKDYYSKFLNINGYNLLESEYLNYHNRLLINYGKIEALKQGQKDIEDDNIFLSIGKRTTELFEKSKEHRVKNEINEDIAGLVNNIMEKDGLNDNEIISTVEEFISKKILLGISNVYLTGISGNTIPKLNRGYDIKILPIHNEAKIAFVYPKFYKDTFDYIIQRNFDYLTINIKNILLGYISKRETYIDHITELPNSRKLLGDLSKIDNNEATKFYEINIKGISDINKKFGHKDGDKVFKEITVKLKQKFYQGTLYRLNGIRLGLLMNNFTGLGSFNTLSFDLDNNDDDIALDIELLIKNILKEYGITNPGVTVGIGGGKTDKVLINSGNALKYALEKGRLSSIEINY